MYRRTDQRFDVAAADSEKKSSVCETMAMDCGGDSVLVTVIEPLISPPRYIWFETETDIQQQGFKLIQSDDL